ncbi:hypothetical protein ABC270_08900 [Curtobacterium sp. 1P10AnD]|uniref:hypothetical protein n=1 Tax=Curtobacterium sp. 1P10AnD TaxID=3132283 RepID=UPI00399F7E7D
MLWIRGVTLLASAAIAMATFLTPAATTYGMRDPFTPCDGVVRPTSATQVSEHDFCSLAVRNIGRLRAGQAALVTGAVVVDDSNNAPRIDQRAFLNVQLRCFLADRPDRAVFGTDAVRNVYTGIPRTTISPRAVLLVRTTGDYTCVLDARQYNVAANVPDRTWRMDAPQIKSQTAPHGVSTAGPNHDKWPLTRDDVVPQDGPVSAARLDFEPSRGVRRVQIDTSVPLSTCAYHSPDTDACWPAADPAPLLNPGQPFVAMVQLRAEQHERGSRGDSCGTPLDVHTRIEVTSVTHHLTVELGGTLRLDSRCSGPVTVDSVVSAVAGRGYIGTAGPARGEAGKAFQDDIGAFWG